ncbi:MAG: hypothetical protein WD491_04595 [Balneolales bacterium]
MLYSEKYFFLCRIPLSAVGPTDVEILQKAQNTEEFPALFDQFEEKRSHAFNKDKLYSIVRADEIFAIVRTNNDKQAKEEAFENVRADLVTNLEQKVMQHKDKNAVSILRKVHDVEMKI